MLSTSVLRPGVNRVGSPGLSVGFADADAAATGAVVVSDAAANTVVVFGVAGKKTATITGFNQPQGLASDTSGDVYVANTKSSNILVYKNDYKTLLATLKDPNQAPAGVAVDQTTGVVGVTNIITTAGGAGSVSFYAKGATKSCATVSSTAWARIYFGAFDAAGNFFIDGQNSSGATLVGEVTGGCAAKAITTLTTSNTIGFPGGIQVGPADKIVIDDQNGPALYRYNAPAKGSLGKPVSTTPLTGGSDPVTFSFTKTAFHVFTADAGLGESLEYAFPAGGAAVATFTGLSQPIGVVVTPVEQP